MKGLRSREATLFISCRFRLPFGCGTPFMPVVTSNACVCGLRTAAFDQLCPLSRHETACRSWPRHIHRPGPFDVGLRHRGRIWANPYVCPDRAHSCRPRSLHATQGWVVPAACQARPAGALANADYPHPVQQRPRGNPRHLRSPCARSRQPGTTGTAIPFRGNVDFLFSYVRPAGPAAAGRAAPRPGDTRAACAPGRPSAAPSGSGSEK